MTAALLRRTATCLRSRAEAVTGDRWDGVGLWRLTAPDVLAEPWAGVLDDAADVVEAVARASALRSPTRVRPYPCTDQRPETGSGELGRLSGRSRPDSTTDEPRRAA